MAVSVQFKRPQKYEEGKTTSYSDVSEIEPGDKLFVAVPSHAVMGHVVRPATDLANALGCDVELSIARDDTTLGFHNESPMPVSSLQAAIQFSDPDSQFGHSGFGGGVDAARFSRDA